MHVHGKLKVGMCVTSKVHVGLDIYLHAPNRSAIYSNNNYYSSDYNYNRTLTPQDVLKLGTSKIIL